MAPRIRVPSIDTILPRNTPSCLQFSTTTRLGAANTKGKPGKQGQQPVNKKGKKFVLATRKDRDVSRNAPNPGERRAWKNRIVLSNTNANDVPGLRHLTPENMVNEQTLGTVMSMPGDAVDSLRSLRAFKRTQAWASYKKPAVLMTEPSWNLAKLMIDVQSNSQSGSSSIAKVVDGPRRCGKSVFLLQALLMGILQKWIVINIPESRELVDARSNYRPLPGSNPAQFMQMEATTELLRSIADANQSVLKDLIMSKAYEGIALDPSKRKASLWDLAQQGILDSEISWLVFSALWNELTLPNNTLETESLGKRPPILYCADSISHMLVPSRYQVLDGEANLRPIHALDLLLPRHFIDHVSGAKRFSNGGITLGATSKSDTISCPPLEVGIQLGQARLESPEANLQVSDFWNPLRRIDQRVMDVLSSLEVIDLKGIPKEEAKRLIEYWVYSGMVRERIADSWVGEKWTLSGGGILGELEKSVVRMRF